MTRIKRNTGKGLERQVELAGQWYRQNGLAWLERTEPPQRWVNGNPVNVRPALADFLGAYWADRYESVPVAVECKSIAGHHPDGLTLAKVLPRVDQRERLHAASKFWQVMVVVETDLGRGVMYHVAEMTDARFGVGAIRLEPCRLLPNGAPDFLGLKEAR